MVHAGSPIDGSVSTQKYYECRMKIQFLAVHRVLQMNQVAQVF